MHRWQTTWATQPAKQPFIFYRESSVSSGQFSWLFFLQMFYAVDDCHQWPFRSKNWVLFGRKEWMDFQLFSSMAGARRYNSIEQQDEKQYCPLTSSYQGDGLHRNPWQGWVCAHYVLADFWCAQLWQGSPVQGGTESRSFLHLLLPQPVIGAWKVYIWLASLLWRSLNIQEQNFHNWFKLKVNALTVFSSNLFFLSRASSG